jgi:hypothetical protein
MERSTRFPTSDSPTFRVEAVMSEESSPIAGQNNCCLCSEDAKVTLVAIGVISLIASVLIMPVLSAVLTTTVVLLASTAIYQIAINLASSTRSAASGRVSESSRTPPQVNINLSAPAYRPRFSGAAGIGLRQPSYASQPYGHGHEQASFQPFGGFPSNPLPPPTTSLYSTGPAPFVGRAAVGASSGHSSSQQTGGIAGAPRAAVGRFGL